MFKSLAAAMLAYMANAQQPPCGKGFYPTVNGCKCIDQWSVPVAGEIDVCQCLDNTTNWNADGTFCRMPNAEVLAQTNAVRSRYYPFDTAETRRDNAKEKLAAWRAKQLQRAKEVRRAGFDVQPNPENFAWDWWKDFDEDARDEYVKAQKKVYQKWNGLPMAQRRAAWGNYRVNRWAGAWKGWGNGLSPAQQRDAWGSARVNRSPGVVYNWDPYNQRDWYYNGNRMVPTQALPAVEYDGETWYEWGGWWWSCPKELCSVPHLDTVHVQRMKDINDTAANAEAMIDEAYPIDAKIESVPFSNNIDTVASSTGALNGMSRLNPQWQGSANPFNNLEPSFLGDSTTWPNNDRLPSTPAKLMGPPNPMILPQMP